MAYQKRVLWIEHLYAIVMCKILHTQDITCRTNLNRSIRHREPYLLPNNAFFYFSYILLLLPTLVFLNGTANSRAFAKQF